MMVVEVLDCIRENFAGSEGHVRQRFRQLAVSKEIGLLKYQFVKI